MNGMVVVLDDDHAIRAGLERLLSAHGYQVRLYAEPRELFREGLPAAPACLLLDNQLGEGITGVQVHEELLRRGWFIPTVFLTAHWNVQLVVNAMRSGADGFLTKPFDPAELIEAVALALQRSRAKQQDGFAVAEARTKVASLTPREREIVNLVAESLSNQEIAARLNLALVTVKVHRARAMQKLGAGNSAELIRLLRLATRAKEGAATDISIRNEAGCSPIGSP